MITNGDLNRLISAHERVRDALARKKPRNAAKIVCEELQGLLSLGGFWSRVAEVREKLQVHQARENEILANILRFVEAEQRIFFELGTDPTETDEIVSDVYAALRLSQELPQLTVDALDVLKERLTRATSLVCEQAKGPTRRALEWIVSKRGALILAGAAVAAANILVIQTPAGIAVGHPHAPTSWISVRAGIKLMAGDVDGVIEIFTGHGG